MNNKGFTLIELLAVIVILGLLLLLFIPAFGDISVDKNRYEYVDLDGNKGYSSSCYEDDGLFCSLDGGTIQVRQFKRN